MESGQVAPETELQWCPLVAPEPVVLPEDISEAKLYVERAVLGFAGMMDELHPACTSAIADKYGVKDSGKSGCVSTSSSRPFYLGCPFYLLRHGLCFFITGCYNA